MLGLMRDTRLDKAKKMMREVAAYAEDVARDERLRADIRSAATHGAKASERVTKDVDGGGITRQLADDKNLRRNLSAMSDDLDDVFRRLRGKKRHRARNALLVASGVVAAVVVWSKARLWFLGQPSDALETPDSQIAPTV